MKNSLNRKLSVVFIILALVLVAQRYAPILSRQFPSPKQAEFELKSYKKNNTQKIVVRKDQKTVTLQNNNGQWSVNGNRADIKSVDDLFKSFSETELKHVVSKNSSNHESFGFSAGNLTDATISAQTQKLMIQIGNYSPEQNSFYIRKIDSVNVYLASGSLAARLTPEISVWRNKSLIPYKQDELTRVTITGTKNFSLIKDKNGWKIQADGKTEQPDQNKIQSVLGVLSGLEGYDFANTDETADFNSSPEYSTIRIEAGNGKTELRAVKMQDYYLVSRSGEDLMKVYLSNLDNLFNLR